MSVGGKKMDSKRPKADGILGGRYSTMDNVDGKQARRTAQSSGLGELFEYDPKIHSGFNQVLIMVAAMELTH